MENPINGIPLILETSICTFIHSALLAHHYSPLILRKLFGVEDDFFTKLENYGGFPQNLQESHGHLKYTPRILTSEPPEKKKMLVFRKPTNLLLLLWQLHLWDSDSAAF